MDDSFLANLVYLLFLGFIALFLTLFSTEDRICNGSTAIYSHKIFNIEYKKEIKEKDTYCTYH